MIVEEIMKSDVSTLTSDNTIEDAIQLMKTKRIRHLPVIDKSQHIIGLVTDRDIKDATPSIFYATGKRDILKKTVKEIMRTNIITGHPLDFVEEISAVFYEHHISCLPIVNDQKLVGIITETDLLHTLVQLTGAHQPGSQIEVKVPNRTGMLCEVTAVISKRKANLLSVLVYPDKKDENYKILVLRVQTMNPVTLIDELKKAGYTVLWPNLPGITT
jgi:acetoin utilization protein AcuB